MPKLNLKHLEIWLLRQIWNRTYAKHGWMTNSDVRLWDLVAASYSNDKTNVPPSFLPFWRQEREGVCLYWAMLGWTTCRAPCTGHWWPQASRSHTHIWWHVLPCLRPLLMTRAAYSAAMSQLYDEDDDFIVGHRGFVCLCFKFPGRWNHRRKKL